MTKMKYFLFVSSFIAALLIPGAAFATKGKVTTYLGVLYSGDGLSAENAYLDNPGGFVVDASGNFYIADTVNNVIRYIDATTNIITTFAGTGQMGYRDGAKAQATFRQPEDVAVAADGTVYVADTLYGRVREIRNGQVSTWKQQFKKPTGLYYASPYLYVVDNTAGKIWRGNTTTRKFFLVASINQPMKLTGIGNSRLYVVSHGQTRVTQINLNSKGVQTGAQKTIKSKLADIMGISMKGTLLYFTAGSNGIYNEVWRANTAETNPVVTRIVNRLETEWYNYASDMLFKGDTMYLLFSRSSSIYQLDSDAQNPVRIAGKHRYGSEFGTLPTDTIVLGKPKALAATRDGKTVYLAQNHQFAKYTVATKTLTFIAGHYNDNYVEGTGDVARTSQPQDIVLSKNETTLYFVDRHNNRIRSLDLAKGTTAYITGAGKTNLSSGAKNAYREGGPCPTTLAMTSRVCAYFDRPSGIALSTDGKTLYIADAGNNRIRAVTIATGKTKLIAGSGAAGSKDGKAKVAQFRGPQGLVLSVDGKTLYVVDRGNNKIRAIILKTGVVSTVAGSGKSGNADGTLLKAQFNLPEYAVRGANNVLYVTESSNRVRVVDFKNKRTGVLAGSGQKGSVNGVGKKATFYNPKGITFLGTKLLVADLTNDLIRQIETK